MAALRLDLDSVRAGARRLIIACGILLAVTLCMFGDVLLSGEHHILSKDGEDLSRILLYYQQFGLDELRKGNLPLWNPHLFSGSPYLGAFQPALLYPLNWLHLAFPLATGINVGIALHCFMAGLWTYLWTSHRKLHLAACIFAGVMFMLCGAHFLQIYRGHLPNLRTIVWVPLILLAVDGLLETSSLGWLLLGSAAVALQILAGHIQYVFYGAVITAIYAFIGWFTSRRNSRAACALLALYPAGASLAAIQLLPGIQAASESLRADFPYEIARTFAFPPENLMTLVLPGILGDMVTMPYWGRWTLSEMSLYIGAAGFLLTVCGIVHGAKTQKRFALTMALIALILSFGYYTPLFRLLYDYAPGFASFRGVAKFAVFATLFLVMLAAVGLDHLLTTRELPIWPLRATLATGAMFVLTGWALLTAAAQGAEGPWGRLLLSVDFHDEAFLYYPVDRSGDFVWQAGKNAAQSLLWGGGAAFFLAVLWWGARRARVVVYGIAILGSLELFTYALHSRPTFDPAPWMGYVAELRGFLTTAGTGYRVLSRNPSVAMSAGADNIWGSDPMVLSRYARFIAFTQGVDPGTLMMSGGVRNLSPLFSMLRLRYVFRPDIQRSQLFASPIQELPRALLVSRCRVFPEGREVLATMSNPAFDPHEIVLLETNPDPAPVESERKGSVSVVDVSTDAMEIHADVPEPAILVVTDTYSSGWRITPLQNESRQTYTVMPANYTLRAIPLAAGQHHLRLEYAPWAFVAGKWITFVSLLAYAVACGWLLRRDVLRSGPEERL